MAKTIGQYIPPEDKHAYESAFEIARPDGTVRKAYPKSVVDASTANQGIVRFQFNLAVNIFLSQPLRTFAAWLESWESYTWENRLWGPLVGPRGRSWWYGQAAQQSKWYYTYYMEQTLQAFFTNQWPNWTKLDNWENFYWTRLVWN